MKRIRCPNCNSYRIQGDRHSFRCRKCGFKHSPEGDFKRTLGMNGETTLAVGVTGLVNGKYFPMLEYDNISLFDIKQKCFEIQKQFKLHRASIYETQNGYHIRFYYDNQFTREKVVKIVEASHCSKEYVDIVRKKLPVNRVLGKYKKPDIRFVEDVGALPPDEKQIKIGHSLRKLFKLLHNKQFLPPSILLENKEDSI